jgi:hypothetical protein
MLALNNGLLLVGSNGWWLSVDVSKDWIGVLKSDVQSTARRAPLFLGCPYYITMRTDRDVNHDANGPRRE